MNPEPLGGEPPVIGTVLCDGWLISRRMREHGACTYHECQGSGLIKHMHRCRHCGFTWSWDDDVDLVKEVPLI